MLPYFVSIVIWVERPRARFRPPGRNGGSIHDSLNNVDSEQENKVFFATVVYFYKAAPNHRGMRPRFGSEPHCVSFSSPSSSGVRVERPWAPFRPPGPIVLLGSVAALWPKAAIAKKTLFFFSSPATSTQPTCPPGPHLGFDMGYGHGLNLGLHPGAMQHPLVLAHMGVHGFLTGP